MFKFIIPLFLIVLSGGLFFTYINPAYTETSDLKEVQQEYDNALTKSKELREVRQELLAKYNSFSEEDIKRIGKLLPDNIDNVKLIMEINQIAVRNGGMIRSIDIYSETNDSNKKGDLGPNLKGYDSIGLRFVVEARYDDFVNFMHDLSDNLRIVDIVDYTLKAGQGEIYKHNVNIKTYWLK